MHKFLMNLSYQEIRTWFDKYTAAIKDHLVWWTINQRHYESMLKNKLTRFGYINNKRKASVP